LRAIGDVEFAALFDDHYDAIAGYLRRRVDHGIADELAAQTFLEAYDRRATYDPRRGQPRAWLYGIAINLLRHHRRSEERRLRAYARAAAAESQEDVPDVCGRLDARASAPALAAALAALSATDREVLLLYAWADLSYAEIATAVGVPVGTVRSRLNRARHAVRERLVDDPALTGLEGVRWMNSS
jgi:RNA polymerase sigma factor (sigma-70 family)